MLKRFLNLASILKYNLLIFISTILFMKNSKVKNTSALHLLGIKFLKNK